MMRNRQARVLSSHGGGIAAVCGLMLMLSGCGNDDGYLDGYEPIQQSGGGAATATGERSAAPAPPGGKSEQATAADSGDPTVAAFLGLEGPKPESWTVEPPQNPMIHTNYVIPAPDGGEPAYVNVYFFGAGMGGPVEDNVRRWAGQFRSPEGEPVEPVVESYEVDSMPVTFVELAGEYQGMGDTWHQPDHLLIAAIIDAPAGRLFIRTVGEAATIEHNREAFERLIRGLRRVIGE